MEEEFIARSRKLAGMIKEQKDEIQFLRDEAKRQMQIIESQKEGKNVWDALSSYNPIKRSKSRN